MARRRWVAAPVSVVVPEHLLAGSPCELIDRYVPPGERPDLPGLGSDVDAVRFATLAAMARRRFHDDQMRWATEQGLGWFEFCRLRQRQVDQHGS